MHSVDVTEDIFENNWNATLFSIICPLFCDLINTTYIYCR